MNFNRKVDMDFDRKAYVARSKSSMGALNQLQYLYSENERQINNALLELKHKDNTIMEKLNSMENYIELINELAHTPVAYYNLDENLQIFNRYNKFVQQLLNECQLETENVKDITPRVFDLFQRSNQNKDDIKRELSKEYQEFNYLSTNQ
jgi:hypothetical protein